MTKHNRRGFTLIEVLLFLAITSLLFLGVTIGVQNSIFEQRYNDSVQSFMEFLRTAYSEVLNVQDIGGGRSERAIYGKLITFGENTNPSGTQNSDHAIFVYDVIANAEVVGDESGSTNGDAKTLLKNMNVNVLVNEGGKVKPFGIVESYTPKWGATINPPCDGTNCYYDSVSGSVLIIRHPNSGTVYTYSGSVIQVNEKIKNNAVGDYAGVLSSVILTFSSSADIDFCVNPDGGETSRIRRDVRIEAGARNASGVEMIPDYESRCKK